MAFVRNYFDFDTVNWKRLIKNSVSEHKFIELLGEPLTDFGKPLLQVCIDNEEKADWDKNRKW